MTYTPTPEHIYSPDVTEAEIRMWRAGYAQGQRDALTQAADDLRVWVDHDDCDIPDWHSGMVAAVEIVEGLLAEQVGE